jgi:alpha-D-xyloside xylohydrolase
VGHTPEEWANDWRFVLGDSLLAAPLIDESGTREVVLPANDNGARWIDWWNLGGESLAPSTITFEATSTREMPVFVKEGSVIPMRIDSDATGLGEASFRDALTVLAFPGPTLTTFELHDPVDDTTAAFTMRPASDGGSLRIDGAKGRVIVRLREASVDGVTLNGVALPEAASLSSLASGASSFVVDRDGRAVWISVEDGA